MKRLVVLCSMLSLLLAFLACEKNPTTVTALKDVKPGQVVVVLKGKVKFADGQVYESIGKETTFVLPEKYWKSNLNKDKSLGKSMLVDPYEQEDTVVGTGFYLNAQSSIAFYKYFEINVDECYYYWSTKPKTSIGSNACTTNWDQYSYIYDIPDLSAISLETSHSPAPGVYTGIYGDEDGAEEVDRNPLYLIQLYIQNNDQHYALNVQWMHILIKGRYPVFCS